jgi:hypothetical protein
MPAKPISPVSATRKEKYSPKPATKRKVKYSPKAAPKSRSIDGGASHVRYAHKWLPREIDIVCPRCSGRVIAQCNSSTGPIAPNASLWSLACTSCMFRRHDVAFPNVTPFFHEFQVSRCKVWAWNLEHLLFLCKVLKGESTKGGSFHGYRTYIPRTWLKIANRDRIAKAIKKRIAVDQGVDARP